MTRPTGKPVGRPKGAKTKRPAMYRKLKENEDSLDLLRLVYRDNNTPTAFRLQAAHSAAPYERKKMPMAIEGTNKPIPVIDAKELASMSTEDLRKVAAALDVLQKDDEGGK